MYRPYESDMYTSPLNNSTLEYRTSDVLKPDVVTDTMANIACKMINLQSQVDEVRVLELGVGAAPFLAQVASGAIGGSRLQLDGVDIDGSVVPFAEYNVNRALAERNNAGDRANITVQSWDEVLTGTEIYDFIYLNPPYLPVGEKVRSEFQNAPFTSMYVVGSADGLDCYSDVLPRVERAMRPGARLFVRTPRDVEKYEAILKIARDSFSSAFTIHTVEARAELDQRIGRGFVVELADTSPKSFSMEPVRTIGLALIEKLAA